MAHTLQSTLKCELNIIKAKNLDFISTAGNLFVRYYLVDGKGSRIRLNSREIRSTSDPAWNEHVSLECQGATHSTLGVLGQQTVVLELRWRSSAPVIGRMVRSKLLGRAEMAWKDVLESMDMSVEKWVTLKISSGGVVGLKPPALRLGMKVEVVEKEKSRAVLGSNRWKECSCRHCENGRDEEIFAIAAALELL